MKATCLAGWLSWRGWPRFLVRQNLCLLYREVKAQQARFYAESGEETQALQWLEGVDIAVDRDLGLTRGIEVFNAACVLTSLLRWEEADQLLSCFETAARQAGSRGRELEALVQHAVTLSAMGSQERALDCLRRALELGEIEGYVRVYLDAGQPIMDLIRAFAARPGDSRQHRAAALLKAAAASASYTEITEPATNRAAFSPLSSREIDVLRLLAKGLSNAEIAGKLFVSFATIKTHVSHIYDKLDVQNRAEAVARAKERGII